MASSVEIVAQEECGCRVLYERGSTREYSIEYCSLHKAASAMFEALAQWKEVFLVGAQGGPTKLKINRAWRKTARAFDEAGGEL